MASVVMTEMKMCLRFLMLASCASQARFHSRKAMSDWWESGGEMAPNCWSRLNFLTQYSVDQASWMIKLPSSGLVMNPNRA